MTKRYFVRVELHDAKSDDYETLHAEMKKEGFSRSTKVGGERKKLPTGSYFARASKVGDTRQAACDRVEEAVKRTKKKAAIVVVATKARLLVSGL